MFMGISGGSYDYPIMSGQIQTPRFYSHPDARQLFWAEHTMSADEFGLFKAVYDNPLDQSARAVYADWLEEHSKPESAQLVRLGKVF